MENKPMQPTDAPNERPVLEAAENMDWRQVFLHGGSPCFHLNVKRKRFCGRAKEWPGHLADEFQDHIYVSLENLLAALASPSSAEHAPAGPLRRMREAVECVRHEGNDLGECWMDCRRCRLEKELAALAATNAQPATSRAEGPASDALNALVAEKRQLIMDVINTARNGKWNNLVDNAADYALNGFESAVRESAVRDAALTSQPSAEYAPAPEPDKQARVEKGELRSARGFEEWWDNWILGQKKPYNALTKTDMEICWKSAQREVALAGEPSESAALADQPAATPAQLRSALEKLMNEVSGMLGYAEHVLREQGVLGNTNVNVLQLRVKEAREALAAQPAPVRPDRPSVVGAKPVCLDCNKVGMLNCSHFDECDGQWVYKPDEPAPAPATSAEPLERCPECNSPIFVRGNGTIVAHYGGGIDPNRCKASETKFVPGALRQPRAATSAELRELIMHMWIHDGYPRNGYQQMTTAQKKLFEEIINEDPDGTLRQPPAPATSAEPIVAEGIHYTDSGACPECGNEEIHPGTELWTCECPVRLPRENRDWLTHQWHDRPYPNCHLCRKNK